MGMYKFVQKIVNTRQCVDILLCLPIQCMIIDSYSQLSSLLPNEDNRSMLQEGFGLLSSPILRGQGAGHDVISFKACGCRRGLCLNRQYGASPACDSLDHRAGASWLPSSLCTINFIMPSAWASLSVPPSAFCRCITLSQSSFPSFWSKNGCISFTNWLLCQSRNSTAKCSMQLGKVAL